MEKSFLVVDNEEIKKIEKIINEEFPKKHNENNKIEENILYDSKEIINNNRIIHTISETKFKNKNISNPKNNNGKSI